MAKGKLNRSFAKQVRQVCIGCLLPVLGTLGLETKKNLIIDPLISVPWAVHYIKQIAFRVHTRYGRTGFSAFWDSVTGHSLRVGGYIIYSGTMHNVPGN